MKFGRTFLSIPLAIMFVPGVVRSCGPFIEFARFTAYNKAFPDEFASGKFGVLRPQFSHSDLLVAYRMMSGVLVSAGEMPGPVWNSAQPDSQVWLVARNKVPGVAQLAKFDTDKKTPGGGFEFYPNCLSAAFETAADTLGKRIAAWGASSPQLTEWIRGQDDVFQNCAAGPAIPARIPSAGALLAADREYQIAAAEFYAGQYDKAEVDFDQIARDPSSPWQDISSYVAARVCIREATIGNHEDKLREAAVRLGAIADDPARGKLRVSATDLLNFVRARIEPEDRLTELANQVMQPRLGDRMGPMLADYTDIWYHMEASGHPPAAGRSEATDWVIAFQKGGATVEKWRAKNTTAWLIAALVWAEREKAGAADIHDLIDAARAVKPDSPAYASAAFYGIVRQIQAGQPDVARQWADEALTRKEPPQVSNVFRAERFKLARNWTEFLRFASRIPTSSDLGGDFPLDGADAKIRSKPAFDEDASQSLNTTVPLRLWNDAAQSDLVPRNLQTQIAQAGWTRAIILQDRPAARLFAQRLALLKPELAAEMGTYLAEPDPAAADFDAVYLMLRAPGFEPQLRPGWGRETPVLRRDVFRDNWWYLRGPHPYNQMPSEDQALKDLYPDRKFVPDSFLPPGERKTGTDEWTQILLRGGDGVDFLCSVAIPWAEAHAQDPRVPQALYLTVEATHYGPWGKTGKEWSQQAFTLLHSRYPNSEWTAKTKYWY